MSDLLNLNCPNCGSQLKVDTTNMKTVCQFCGTEILIKDFITERRVDKGDMLASYSAIVENALKNKNYNEAYDYSKKICELEAGEENISRMNLYGFLSGNLKFNREWLKKLYSLPIDEHRKFLDEILSSLNSKKQSEVSNISPALSKQERNAETFKINNRYASDINAVSAEINKLKTKRCKCGAEIEYDSDICPKCGLSYKKYQSDMLAAKKQRQKRNIKLAVIIGIPVAICAVIFAFVYNNARIGNINNAINSGDYSTAEALLDDYQSSNQRRADVYEMYADLYLAQNKSPKAIEKLNEGLKQVSSGDRDDLNERIDEIKKEYRIG